MNGKASHESVQALAYQLWQQRGGVDGSPEEDWLRAEQILAQQEQAAGDASASTDGSGDGVSTSQVDNAVEESFPASDPPAVHAKDEPPVNAREKWKAAGNASAARRGGRGQPRTQH